VDIQGKFGGYLGAANAKAIIVRPDFYIFGDASDSQGVNGLVDSLRAQLNTFGFEARATRAVA
jgi:flavoprotein hydroxylase